MTITMFLTCWTAHTEKNMFVLSKFVIGNKVGVVNIAVWSKDVQKKNETNVRFVVVPSL